MCYKTYEHSTIQYNTVQYSIIQYSIVQYKTIHMQDRSFMTAFQRLQPNSDEWKLIEFKLQLSLARSSVVIKSISCIENTHLGASFSNYAKGNIVLQSFYATQKLSQNNKLVKVCQKGYEFPAEGMMFTVGFNSIRDSTKEQLCIMNKLSVGKSYCYPSANFLQSPIPCPQGFQSIYLYNEEEDPQIFKHQYVVFKTHQVLPVYVIEYVVDSTKEQMSKPPLCDNCNKIPPDLAKFYCIDENAYFCVECEHDYHSKSKVAGKHKRVQITQKPKKFGLCQKHQEVELQLYCSVCCEALCVNCKIFGSHMFDEMSKHSLSKLKDAYSQISSKVKEIDPNIERRKNQLTDDLAKIDLRIKEINLKATHIEEQLRALFQKTLRELKQETQRKLSFLICDQLELKRQYDHIQWMDKFIRHQLQIQEPQQFLLSWYKYSRYKKEILSLSNLSINTQVKADMRLEGDIKIITDSKARRQEQSIQKDMLMSEFMHSAQKEGTNRTAEKELGSTSLRKTIFKKHYMGKIQEMGMEPSMLRGTTSNFAATHPTQ